ncbi:MAG: hypothetical protein N3B01_04705, partial [Verrucomicrobiae bacterium]|nr:hypothetical protein [Verrucomicrobiae bacterium]
MKRLLRWLTHSVWPVVAVVLVALLYLNQHGFPPPVRDFIRQQFLQHGYLVNFKSLRLDWFGGIVAEELTLADARRAGERLLEVTEVALQINWLKLPGGRHVVRGLRIVNARVSVPMPPDEVGSERFTASDACATLRFEDDGAICVEQLTGKYCGFHVYVTGRIRPARAAPAAGEKRQRNLGIFSKVLRELYSVRSRQPPGLYVDFDLELDKPLELRGRAWLSGQGLRYRRLRIDQLRVDVTMGEGALRIVGAHAKLAGGELDVHGYYDIGKGRTELYAKSSIDIMALRPWLGAELEAQLPPVQLRQNPVIRLQYVLSPETGTEPVLTGSVHARQLGFRGVEFQSVGFDFRKHGPSVVLSNACIVMAKGTLTGHGQYHLESSDFAYEVESTLDPTALLPLMTPTMQRWFAPCVFEDPPHVRAAVRGDFVDPDVFAYEAVVNAGKCSYRGVRWEKASAVLRLYRNRLDVRDLQLQRSDGQLSGKLTIDFDREQMVFDLRSTANPVPMADLLGSTARRAVEPYRFGPNVRIHAKGFVDFVRPERVFWIAEVANDEFQWWKLSAAHAEGTVAYSNDVYRLQLQAEGLAYGTNRAERARADLMITPQNVWVTNAVAEISGGVIQAAAWAEMPQRRVHFHGTSTVAPHTLAALAGPTASKHVEPFRFGSNTVVHASGIADLLKSNQTCWTATVRTDGFGSVSYTHL